MKKILIKSKKHTHNLTFILMSILMVFILAMLGMIYLFQISFLDDFYKESKISDMNRILNQMQSTIDIDLNYTVNDIAETYDACVSIHTESGEDYIADIDSQKGCSLHWLSNAQIEELYDSTKNNNGIGVFNINHLDRNGENPKDLMAVSKMINNGEEDLLLLIADPVTTIAPVSNTIQLQFFYIIAFVVIFTIILALYLSIIFVKPLKKINEEAKSLPLGVYNDEEVKSKIQEMNDINETLKESCLAIEQADIARKELLSNVSHDLRTPLTMIVGYGEMMIDFDDEKTDDNIKLIIDEAKRLSNLVNDLLDLSKAELGKLELKFTTCDLNTFISSVYNQYKVYLENQNIEFNLELDESIEVNIDDSRMRQVLYNFINNAMNYNDKDNPTITIKTQKIDDYVEVSVLDNGKGIAQEDIDKIWERYYKVDKEHKRQLIGSGIGLSLAKTILDAHHLESGVESEVGEYSRFYFRIKEYKENSEE